MSVHDCRERWRTELEIARQRLHFARAFVEEVERDMASGVIAEESGHEAYRRALEEEIRALEEYGRVLQILNPRVVGDQRPGEHEKSMNRAEFETGTESPPE